MFVKTVHGSLGFVLLSGYLIRFLTEVFVILRSAKLNMSVVNQI